MIMKCGRLAQSVEQGTENPRVPSSILGPATIFVSTPVKPTGFFVFSPTTYPQKQPDGVSGKLSATPKPCKTAQLLRFFGNLLCHPRNLTQCVTYYKSTHVYYNIPASFSQAAIRTRRDSNLCTLALITTELLYDHLKKSAMEVYCTKGVRL